MDIPPLHTEDDYCAALAEVSALVHLDPEPGTPEGDRLEILSILIEHYESSLDIANLLRSPANFAHLKHSIAQLRAVRAPLHPDAARQAAKRLANLGGTQPGVEGAPRRRFGVLTGRVSMSATFDAPLETDEAAVDRAARDNSDLPRTFVAEALQGLAEVRAGQTVPFVGHNSDFALWAEAQAAKLRDRRVTELDRDSIAEELETLARAFVDCQLRWAPGGHRN